MRPLCSSRNGCAGVPATSVLSSGVPATTSRRYSSRTSRTARGVGLARHGAEESARIAAPAAVGALVIRDERARQLFHVIRIVDLCEQVPAAEAGSKGLRITSPRSRSIEAPQVAAVRVGDDRAVAAAQCRLQHLVNGGALAGAGGADELEVLDLVLRREGDTGDRDAPALCSALPVRAAGAAARWGGASSTSAPRWCTVTVRGRCFRVPGRRHSRGDTQADTRRPVASHPSPRAPVRAVAATPVRCRPRRRPSAAPPPAGRPATAPIGARERTMPASMGTCTAA